MAVFIFRYIICYFCGNVNFKEESYKGNLFDYIKASVVKMNRRDALLAL